MRTREEIWQEREFKGIADESLILELLLDIRDLLEKEKYPNRCLVCGEKSTWLTNGPEGFGDYCSKHRSLPTNKESK